jgi:DNA-binding transcriptional LysR family regulator
MSINVDLDRLKSFVAVGEELHFTRAAQNRLHVSQPWLSRSVKSLEQKLGVQLFERHSRHVELTPPGRRLLYGARKLLHDFDRTVSAVVRDRKGNGHLTVGYSPYVDLRFMTELKEMALGESPTVTLALKARPLRKQCFTLTIGTGTVESSFSRSMRHIWTSFRCSDCRWRQQCKKHIDWQKGER